MSNTLTYAERELDILVKSAESVNRPIIEEFIPEILALVDKFGNSGQSGGSAPYVATAISQAVKHLCLQEPICPITGIDEEWNEVTDMDENKQTLYQNNRCSALFKNADGKCWYLDAIIWKDQKGLCWCGSAITKDGKRLRSRQFIKGFPFTPKTFYIDVISTEISPGDWEDVIKNEKQLNAVKKMYNLNYE
jgi:hypothetical protein